MVSTEQAGLPRVIVLLAAVFGLMASSLLVSAGSAQAAPPQPPIPAGEVVRIHTGAPGGATVVGNLTVTGTAANGYLTAFPCDQEQPNASTGNYRAAQSVASFIVMKTDSAGAFCVYTRAGSHVIFDMIATTTALATESPNRKFDSRQPAHGGVSVAARSVIRVETQAPQSVVMGTLTVTGGVASGFLTAFECGTPIPETSNLNFAAMTSVANFVFARTDATGGLCVYTTTTAHIIFDQVGVAADEVVSTDQSSRRLLDSRLPWGTPVIPANSVVRINAGGGASTLFGNITITGAERSGFATVYPCEQQRPDASHINFVAGQTVANLAGVRTNDAGEFCIHTTAPTHVVFDEFARSTSVVASVPVRLADSRRDWLGPSQVISVSVEDARNTWHRLQMWERGVDGKFRQVGSTQLGWVGSAGIGQANSWTPRTPAGTHTLTQSFGIKANPGTRLPFFQVDRFDWWNGDSTHPGYNTRHRGWTAPPNSEHLLSYGKAYWYSVVMDYNIERVPYAGAAFFLHVATGEPTGGCVSVSEAAMVEIMRWLDPAKAPVITIGVQREATAIVDRANA